MEAGTGFPGYDSVMQKDTATVAEVLKQNGWNTSWFGKNHNVPDWQSSQAGPFDLWPTGLGFEHFYGFIGGDTNQWRPAVVEGTKPIDPYLGKPDYNFDYDMADQAIKWIRMQKSVAPGPALLLLLRPGRDPRSPPSEEGMGRQVQGQVRRRLGRDPRADPRPPEEARRGPAGHEARAAGPRHPGLGHTDRRAEEGLRPDDGGLRGLPGTDRLQRRPGARGDRPGRARPTNTIVIYIVGDNGASAEGSLQGLLNEMTFFNGVKEDLAEVLKRVDDIGTFKTYNHYPIGWAHAMCTPFQWTKQVASHYGGTRNAMVISWPKGIKARGELRTQWHHCIDIVPTIYEACGVTAPTTVNGVPQKPIEGVSMAYTFADAGAKSRRTTQYFEMLGNRAIYHDGWVACTTPPLPPWDPGTADNDVITGYQWELYDTDKDFSQADNLAARNPEKLKELQLQFYTEAARYNVLPLDNSKTSRLDPAIRPSLTRGRKSFTFYRGAEPYSRRCVPRHQEQVMVDHRGSEREGRRQRDDRHPGRPLQRLGAVSGEGQAGIPLQLLRPDSLRDRRDKMHSPPASIRSGWTSPTTAAGSARVVPRPSPSTTRKSRRGVSRGPCPSASRSMKGSTWARTPARR